MNNRYFNEGTNRESYEYPYEPCRYRKSAPVPKRTYAYDVKMQNIDSTCCEPSYGNEVNCLVLGMGYVPWQSWSDNVMDAGDGFQHGTIFPELVKPFVCTPCNKRRGGM